tara:strand:+ start:2368 stop:2814 length:447 start_codon:yes stop_codon:yes gene_type:complete
MDPEGVLPVDVWALIVHHMALQDVGRLRTASKRWNLLVDDSSIDRAVALAYATNVLRDGRFWHFAEARPMRSARPLKTYWAEIRRIRQYEECAGTKLSASKLYVMWRSMDQENHPNCRSSSSLSGSSVCALRADRSHGGSRWVSQSSL